jgi:hypothetical protein
MSNKIEIEFKDRRGDIKIEQIGNSYMIKMENLDHGQTTWESGGKFQNLGEAILKLTSILEGNVRMGFYDNGGTKMKEETKVVPIIGTVTKKINGYTFGVSRMRYQIDIPAGLRVSKVEPYGTIEKAYYVLNEFPNDIFPFNSFIRHDAVHYGIPLDESQVEAAK